MLEHEWIMRRVNRQLLPNATQDEITKAIRQQLEQGVRSDGTEGILPMHLEAIFEVIKSYEELGADITCGILFGSRARGTARVDSDVDVFLLADLFSVNQQLPYSHELVRARDWIMSIQKLEKPEFDLEVFIIDKAGFTQRTMEVDIRETSVLNGIAHDGILIYGQEPIIENKPLLTYLRNRLSDTSDI